MDNKYFLSKEEFVSIYSKVPRLTIDLVIKSEDGILLALRDIIPWKGFWHLPGGTVAKGEKLTDAVLRIAKGETGLDVKIKKELGHLEYLIETRPEANFHSVAMVFEVEPIGGNMTPDENSKELRYFKDLPENIIPEQIEFLERKGFKK
jgi:colanic acid biosynthesis protein WcaH